MKKAHPYTIGVCVCVYCVPFIKSFQEYSATAPQGILEVQTSSKFLKKLTRLKV